MKKGDLARAIAAEAGCTEGKAAKALNFALEEVCRALESGDAVTLTGFGTFAVAERAAREGRNPSTGEPMSIPAKKGVRFSAGGPLKARVNR